MSLPVAHFTHVSSKSFQVTTQVCERVKSKVTPSPCCQALATLENNKLLCPAQNHSALLTRSSTRWVPCHHTEQKLIPRIWSLPSSLKASMPFAGVTFGLIFGEPKSSKLLYKNWKIQNKGQIYWWEQHLHEYTWELSDWAYMCVQLGKLMLSQKIQYWWVNARALLGPLCGASNCRWRISLFHCLVVSFFFFLLPLLFFCPWT